jgi:membrane-bound ClpP family serine protease
MAINDALGIIIVLFGLALIVFEFVHPGAVLLIPGSILVVVGLFYLLIPSVLLDSVFGPIAIVATAVVAILVEVPYYRHIAPVHRPMSTTTAGLLGQTGVVTATVTPHTLQGKVRLQSEVWSARADIEIHVGTMVRVVGGEGVSLIVAPITNGEPSPTTGRDL